MSESELERAMECWPGDWAGTEVVDLDNVGDPGFWLRDRLPELEDALAGDEGAVDAAAARLAEAYLDRAAEMSFPIPSDFEASKEDEMRMITEDFRGFLQEWRRRFATETHTKE